ncbi:methyltransferase domain-containing protein [Cohnella sp. CFH 77786]|uniref:class I SAM-dependent methyltransferase n=1 Tax=Cohnella sp. CFH 77786 TaxID=2662265 RepID=UPI001C60E1E0|nr:methyltransferase domain-containing protein [Cohnella sp. CFH 77786]MBW5445963.1 methyltransferase domain-containing protein [Cohnella sp. CFH 77786]
MSRESFLFLRKFVRQPKQVGSVMPSSGFLGRAMADSVPWAAVTAAAELGAGTGAITRHLARSALPGTAMHLFEKDAAMRESLTRAYPGFRCYSDAADMLEELAGSGAGQMDCIFSGLPFFNFSPELRERLLGQIEGALKPGGYFVAFQYSLQMKKRLSNSFRVERIRFVPWNLPPAFVYVCRRKI